MKRSITFTAVIFLILAASLYGFDGQRRGFVLGGGLGFAPDSKWSIEIDQTVFGQRVQGSLDESAAGLGAQFIIGYAWDDQNMIVYEGNVSLVKSKILLDNQSGQGFNGVAYYHYFGAPGRAFFLAGGLGAYVWKVEEFEANDPGVGYLAGGGYEFLPHVQAGAYISGGKTSDMGFDFGHTHFNILITAIAF